MDEIISVKNQNGELLVSARDLHKGLELSKRFSSWIDQYIKKIINMDLKKMLILQVYLQVRL